MESPENKASLSPTATQGPGEEQLVRAAQQRDTQAIELLFGRHRCMLFQTAMRVLGNPSDAEDALQNALVLAYKNVHRFEGRSHFSTWLTRIVINSALIIRRRAKARPAVSLEEPLPDDSVPLVDRLTDYELNPEQVYAGTEIRDAIHQSLAELSSVQRSAFVLRAVHGYSTQEAAQKLGVNESTLKCRLRRSRLALARSIGRRLPWLSQPNVGRHMWNHTADSC
jgi:RNA polymerase sigma-70 factor (ECF subfamily)